MSKHIRNVVLSVLLFSVFFFAVDAAMADTVRVPLPGASVTVRPGQNGVARFEGDGFQMPGLAGEPQLPYRVLKVLLPPEADLSTVSVSLANVVESEMGGFWDVAPVPPMATWDGEKTIVAWPEGRDIEDGRDVAIYGADAFFPGERTLPCKTGEIRGWKVVDVPVALFRYNPVTRKLKRLEAADVVVDYAGSVSKSVVNGPADTIASDMVRDAVVNYDEEVSAYTGDSDTFRRSGEAESPGYIVVTTQTIAEASDSLDEFVLHKEGLGFDVSVVTEADWGGGIGDEAAENVRSWLAGNYLALNAKYVLLVGNPHPASGDVPMKMLWPRNNAQFYEEYAESPSDLYYADLTGNWDLDGDGYYGEWDDDFGDGGIDTNWEVVVSRIPFYGSIADLDAILAKTIRYESADPAATEWRKKVLLPMKPSDSSTPGYHLGEGIKDDILVPLGDRGYCRVYEEDYGLDPAPEFTPCTVDNVTTAWTEEPFGLVAWWTHGSPTTAGSIMDLDHVSLLDDSHPSIVFQCSCFNAYPERSDNLSYSLLKNGAIVAIGATRVSWYRRGQTEYAGTSSNSGMTYGMSRELIRDGTNSGMALAFLKQEVYVTNDCDWMNYTDFNVYGDPSLGLEAPGFSSGSVTVNIEGPPEARWSLDRGNGHESGQTVWIVSSGTYELSYSDVDGWAKPAVSTITVSDEEGPVVLTATYRKRTLDGPTFVKSGGGGDGTSWDSPRDLADALRDAMSGETILVAEGLYRPKYDRANNAPLPGCGRQRTFSLKSGVTVLGGFPSNLSGTASTGRDPSLYRSVLTGDLEGDDEADVCGIVADVDGIRGDNACHVVSCSGVSDVVLYGLTVTAGRADDDYGGGLYCECSNLAVTDCTFVDNFAEWYGGGMYIEESRVSLRACAFHGNVSGAYGGGMNNNRSTASLDGCSFLRNRADSSGGGLCNLYSDISLTNCTFYANEADFVAAISSFGSSPAVMNCTFAGNVATAEGSTMSHGWKDLPTVTNCIFWDDTAEELDGENWVVSHCVVKRGLDGVASADHIITEDPCLGPLADNGGSMLTCALLPGSSALDAGTSDGVVSADQRGVSRPQGAGVDIGAYEVRPGAVRVFLHGPEEARWSVDGGGEHENGDEVSGLQIGSYRVAFSSVDGWRAPASADVTVTEGDTVLAAGDYGLDVRKPVSWSRVEAGGAVTLEWEPFSVFDGSVDYEVYMLEDGSFVQVPAEKVDGTSVILDLNGHTTYTLRVDADGFEGEPWTFTTLNRAPCLVRRSPVDGVDRLPVETALSWLYVDPDGDSVDYDLYAGSGEALSLVCSGDATSFAPELSGDCEYSWRVVAKDRFEGMEAFEPGVVSSDVWSFAVTSDVHCVTPPLPDEILVAGGVNDIWVATLDSNDMAALEVALGEGVVPATAVLFLDVEPLSGDVASADRRELLEGSGTVIADILSEGFRFGVAVSEDVNLVPVPVTLSFTEEKTGRVLSEETLLDQVHLFVLAGGQAYDLVSLAGDRRDTLFTVTSDADDTGVTYFVSFRLYLADRDTGIASAASGRDVSLFTDTAAPAFLVEGVSTGTGSFSLTVAEGTIPSSSGGGGCSAFGFGPGVALLLGSVFFLIRRK